MAFPELRLLGIWTNTNTASTGLGKAPNTTWQPPSVLTSEPALPQGYLKSNQVGEVAFAVIYSPVEGNGTIDDLSFVKLVLDGTVYDYIVLSGRQDTNMAPATDRIRRGKLLKFGDPTLGANGRPASPLNGTCPKFTDWVSVAATAGATAIVADYTIELWGYVYDAVQLATLMPAYQSMDITISNPRTAATFTVPGRHVESGGDWTKNWLGLMGGREQSSGNGGVIHKLIRQARNANPTTVSQTYKFEYNNSSASPAVAAAHNNLYFKLTKNQALMAERLGVRSPQPTSAGAQLLAAWLATPDETEQRHPEGGINVQYGQNSSSFGLAYGETNKFVAVPELPQGPQLVTNEIAYPTVVDNGTSLDANAIMIAFVAVLIQTGSGNTI